MVKKTEKQEEILNQRPELKRALAEINKKYGAGTIDFASNMPELIKKRISTGIKKLDEATGGGFQLGSFVELYGIESSGKSLISLLTVAQAQKEGLDCIYVDVEHSFDPQWAQKLGVDTSKLVVITETNGEKIHEICKEILDKAEPGVIVIDSVMGMVPNQEADGELDKQYMAPLARLMSRSLKILNSKNKRTLLILVNQVRSNITALGAFGVITPGGHSAKHWASIRVQVHRPTELLTENGKKATDTNPAIGQILQFKVVKNKTSEAKNAGSVKFFYNGSVQE